MSAFEEAINFARNFVGGRKFISPQPQQNSFVSPQPSVTNSMRPSPTISPAPQITPQAASTRRDWNPFTRVLKAQASEAVAPQIEKFGREFDQRIAQIEQQRNQQRRTSKQPMRVSPTPEPTVKLPRQPQVLGASTGQGRSQRAQKLLSKNPMLDVTQAINAAAQKYGIPADLLIDVAAYESSLDPQAAAAKSGFDGTTINPNTGQPYPYSSAAGLFQFTDGTWSDLKKMGVIPPEADKFDPQWAAVGAAYYMKNMGQLHRWYPSMGGDGREGWASNYSAEEIQPYIKYPQYVPEAQRQYFGL